MNRLKELRKKMGVMQKDIAKNINVSKSTYSYWENGNYEPDQESLKLLADYFNVTVDYLIGRDEKGSLPEKGNTVLTIGRDGKRFEYEIPDENAELAQRLLSELAKKKK